MSLSMHIEDANCSACSQVRAEYKSFSQHPPPTVASCRFTGQPNLLGRYVYLKTWFAHIGTLCYYTIASLAFGT